MAAVRLDCAALLADTDAPGATPATPKRKASSDFSDAVPSSFPRLDDAAAPSSPKRAKPARGSDALDDHQLLASIDSGFRSMDDSGGERHQAGAAEGSSGGKAAGDAGEPKARSRWEGDSDDEADAGADDAQAPSGAAAASLTADARLAELLQGRTRGPKKSVRWPDQMDEGDDDGVDAFRIGRPRQLEIVHWVEGLGPPPGSMRAGAADSAPSMATAVQPQPGGSFADAVRAEHRVERSLLHMDDS